MFPISPGGGPKIGLGVWNSLPATLAIELGLFAIGTWLYVNTTKSQDRIGSAGFATMLALLLLIFFGALFGPPPPDAQTVALSDLGQLLVVAMAVWVDGHRKPLTTPTFTVQSHVARNP